MIKNLTVREDITIKDAMKQLDLTAEKVLLIVSDDNVLLGALTDGDVRRAILAGMKIEDTIKGVYNSHPIFLYSDNVSEVTLQNVLIQNKIELIPIVDNERRVVNFVTWDNVFKHEYKELFLRAEKIDTPVVIMAGGKGTRMEPFTKVLPKPLIPVGEKTIAELIIEQFRVFGVREYYFTLNYKGEMIRAYFESIERDYNIKYIQETDFYGTAGCLKLLQNEIFSTFILSNCDILVKANYSKVIEFHKENESDITVISAVQHHQIPYGVISFGKNGIVTRIDEKPEHTFTINTGVYVINNNCLQHIPDGSVFHMTDLIEKVIEIGGRVFTYPVNTNDYIDIGQWDEYRQTVNKLATS